MISVTSDMIFRAVVSSSLLGAVSGIIRILIRMLSTLFLVVVTHLFKSKKKTVERIYKHAVFSNVCDLAFVLAVGIAYILMLYAFTDGVFYLVTLVALLGSFMAVNTITLSISKIRKR